MDARNSKGLVDMCWVSEFYTPAGGTPSSLLNRFRAVPRRVYPSIHISTSQCCLPLFLSSRPLRAPSLIGQLPHQKSFPFTHRPPLLLHSPEARLSNGLRLTATSSLDRRHNRSSSPLDGGLTTSRASEQDLVYSEVSTLQEGSIILSIYITQDFRLVRFSQ